MANPGCQSIKSLYSIDIQPSPRFSTTSLSSVRPMVQRRLTSDGIISPQGTLNNHHRLYGPRKQPHSESLKFSGQPPSYQEAMASLLSSSPSYRTLAPQPVYSPFYNFPNVSSQLRHPRPLPELPYQRLNPCTIENNILDSEHRVSRPKLERNSSSWIRRLSSITDSVINQQPKNKLRKPRPSSDIERHLGSIQKVHAQAIKHSPLPETTTRPPLSTRNRYKSQRSRSSSSGSQNFLRQQLGPSHERLALERRNQRLVQLELIQANLNPQPCLIDKKQLL
ncbi:hypothetical protein BY996DRAFT_6413300 [Phakopsora pachyrhizi]|nr:hypothetical protein BY996DRAFT_6413300 [Phakopsora pachyrhizi]